MTTELISNVKRIVESGDTTYGAIAREIEMSTTALSQFINDKYAGDNEALASKLTTWLSDRDIRQNEMPSSPAFVHTPTAKRIWDTLQYAQLARCITVIYGNPGVGKTKALTQYQAERPSVVMVRIKPSQATLVECLYEIALELGLGDLSRRSGPLARAIRRKLQGTNGLLIIDEADHLEYPVLEELRLLQEETSIGLVLCGNHQVYAKLTGGGSRSLDLARLFSRIAKKISILKTTKGDVNAIVDAWGISGAPERNLIHNLADKPGALRTVDYTLRLAAMFAHGNKEPITEVHIRSAVKDLEGI